MKLLIFFRGDSLDVSDVERRSSGGCTFLSTRADVGLVVLTVLVRIGRYIYEIRNSEMKRGLDQKMVIYPRETDVKRECARELTWDCVLSRDQGYEG